VFSRQISADVGAIETVMFRGGYLSEAAASNVWVVQDGCVLGTPKDHLVLEGIRYGLIEELCRAAGLGFELRRISRAEVFAADELLLSSATKEILAAANPALSMPSCTPATNAPRRNQRHEQTDNSVSPFCNICNVGTRSAARIADRIPVAVPHQGDGPQGRRLAARHHDDRARI
jgi:hypothetical protein